MTPRSCQLGQRAQQTRVVLELNHAAASGLMTGCGCGLSENNNLVIPTVLNRYSAGRALLAFPNNHLRRRDHNVASTFRL